MYLKMIAMTLIILREISRGQFFHNKLFIWAALRPDF